MSPRSSAPSLGAIALLAILIAVLLAGGCEQEGDEPAAEAGDQPRQAARVLRVVDGDTIEVRLGGETEDVRYIGVDTPESVKPGTPVECFALQASHFNERLVEGERVLLVFDAERRDVYGRLLAYVYLAGGGQEPRDSVNAELVRRGYATTLTIAPNDSFAGLFARLERRAGAAGRGLWGAC